MSELIKAIIEVPEYIINICKVKGITKNKDIKIIYESFIIHVMDGNGFNSEEDYFEKWINKMINEIRSQLKIKSND